MHLQIIKVINSKYNNGRLIKNKINSKILAFKAKLFRLIIVTLFKVNKNRKFYNNNINLMVKVKVNLVI